MDNKKKLTDDELDQVAGGLDDNPSGSGAWILYCVGFSSSPGCDYEKEFDSKKAAEAWKMVRSSCPNCRGRVQVKQR